METHQLNEDGSKLEDVGDKVCELTLDECKVRRSTNKYFVMCNVM